MLSFSTAATLLPPKLLTLLCCCCFSLWSTDVYLSTTAAMATPKRLYEDIDDFDELNEPVPNASIHTAVLSLSPYKKGEMRHILMEPSQMGHEKYVLLDSALISRRNYHPIKRVSTPIILNNCEIKQSRQGDQYEILL